MTKAELLTEVSRTTGVSKVDAEEVLEAFFHAATVAAHGKNQVSWPGFGSFRGVHRKARTGRNPQTGAPVPVAARTVMKFTSSSKLNETLKASRAPAKRPAAKKATTKSATKVTKKSAKKATKKAPKKSAKKATKKAAKKTAKKAARGRRR
jgi:DNA-binding protein HU-beta